jgi:hypothetical protein
LLITFESLESLESHVELEVKWRNAKDDGYIRTSAPL